MATQHDYYAYPEDQSWRMDMKNVKLFEQKAFMDALEVIGFYEA